MSYHAAHLAPDPNRAEVWRAVAAHLTPWVAEADPVLEIGAGYCDWINQVQGRERVAVDVWPGFTAHAAPGVDTRVLDASCDLLQLGEGRFGTVLASNVLEHFSPDAAAQVAADVRRLLKPGGRLIAVQPNFRLAYRRYFDDYTHRAIFTDVSLPAMLRAAGLDTEHVHPRFLPYSMQGARLRPRGWMVRAYLASPVRPAAGQMLVVARKG